MITYTSGDPLLTQAQTLAFGYNAKGRSEMTPLATALLYQNPAAFATFGKQCRNERLKPGQMWAWRESRPYLLFLVVRESSVGMTRLRFVEAVAMTLARDYKLYGINSLAIAPLGTDGEWPMLKDVLHRWLSPSKLSVVVY